jgi:hypothetical protein
LRYLDLIDSTPPEFREVKSALGLMELADLDEFVDPERRMRFLLSKAKKLKVRFASVQLLEWKLISVVERIGGLPTRSSSSSPA